MWHKPYNGWWSNKCVKHDIQNKKLSFCWSLGIMIKELDFYLKTFSVRVNTWVHIYYFSIDGFQGSTFFHPHKMHCDRFTGVGLYFILSFIIMYSSNEKFRLAYIAKFTKPPCGSVKSCVGWMDVTKAAWCFGCDIFRAKEMYRLVYKIFSSLTITQIVTLQKCVFCFLFYYNIYFIKSKYIL